MNWNALARIALAVVAAGFLASVAFRAFQLASGEGPGRWVGVAGLAAAGWLGYRMARLLLPSKDSEPHE